VEKSYETGWEQHGDTWRPPAAGQPLSGEVRSLLDAILPPGIVSSYAGATAPPGWLLCDGQSVSKQTYPRLFSVIGYTHGGAGDSFNLPNIKGRVVVHLNAADAEFDVLGETGGAKTHTLTTAEMPSHVHAEDIGVVGGGGADQTVAQVAQWLSSRQNTEPTGGGGAHNNLQPYIVLNSIIKVG
jgi:microcystin-dependent protein